MGRYISLERLIEENRERYYETLKMSSKGWHEGRHNPWPYIGFLLYIIKKAYLEFEERVGSLTAPKGEKTRLIQTTISNFSGDFTVGDIQTACPEVSIDLIRRTLKKLKSEGSVECLGMGRAASWRRI